MVRKLMQLSKRSSFTDYRGSEMKSHTRKYILEIIEILHRIEDIWEWSPYCVGEHPFFTMGHHDGLQIDGMYD